MNVHDSEKILGVLAEEGYSLTEIPQEADLIVLNTCSIRQKAEQKFYSELGRMKSFKKKRKDTKIVVAGCIAQQEGNNIFKRAPYVDYVIGPQNIGNLKEIMSGNIMSIAVEDNKDIAIEDLPIKRNDGLKAWVTIMYGCNNFCSYCVVPYTRGRERSRPSKNIYEEIHALAQKGYKEITLLGQNVNSYCSEMDFPGLLFLIHDIEGIERIRFVTSHPRDLSEELIHAIESLPKVCEHLHLPLQSGSNKILEVMNRCYTYEEYREKVHMIKSRIPNIAITSDIITGFPGEEEEDHLKTIQSLKELSFDGIFAFKFSSRPRTKAYNLKTKISEAIKNERLDEILMVQDVITSRKNRELEKTVQQILVEGVSKTDKNKSFGRTRTNKIVTLPSTDFACGLFLDVEIIKARRHSLDAIPLNE
jgi:tRNA-2-methylthio-N6-dimethylallyladenosine synthase